MARAVLDAPTALRGAVADVVALAERGEGLLRPPMARGGRFEDVAEERLKLLDGSQSDVETGVRILRRGHAQRHGLSASSLDETRRIATVLRRLIEAEHTRPEDDDSRLDMVALARHLLDRLPEQAFVLRPRAMKNRAGRSPRGRGLPYGNGEIELSVEPWSDGKDRSPPLAGLVLSVFWSGSSHGRGVFGRGSLLLPCKLEWLAEAGLGEVSVGRVHVIKQAGQVRLEAHVDRRLAEVALSTVVEELRGDAALDAAARTIAEGRLLKPAAELLADALHLAEVARVLHLTRDRLEFDDVERAARKRLVELGVTCPHLCVHIQS